MCGSDTYKVHKAIICPQSDFFRAACRADTFQEGKTNTITIAASSGRDESTSPLALAEDFDWDLDVETTTSVKLMIHYFYHHDYLEHEVVHIQGLDFPKAVLDEHSRMYAMGEKYGIQGLKRVALAKFQGRGGPRQMSKSSVIAAAVIAFNSTPESDKDLREAMLEHLDRSRQLFKHSVPIQKMILSMPEVAYGLYRKSIDYNRL